MFLTWTVYFTVDGSEDDVGGDVRAIVFAVRRSDISPTFPLLNFISWPTDNSIKISFVSQAIFQIFPLLEFSFYFFLTHSDLSLPLIMYGLEQFYIFRGLGWGWA